MGTRKVFDKEKEDESTTFPAPVIGYCTPFALVICVHLD